MPTSGTEENGHPIVYNITLYVRPEQVELATRFYKEVLGLAHVFGEPGHIECFHLGVDGLCLCLHEEEQGHQAGQVEFFFATNTPGRYEHLASALIPVIDDNGERVLQSQLRRWGRQSDPGHCCPAWRQAGTLTSPGPRLAPAALSGCPSPVPRPG